MAEIDPYVLYRDNLKRKKICYNHNVVALAGEYLRLKKGLTITKISFIFIWNTSSNICLSLACI